MNTFMKKLLGAAGALAILAGNALPACAATITVVNSDVVSDISGKVVVVTQQTTVATFTAVQNVAQVNLGPGFWQCNGISNNGTVTNASTINLGISLHTGALPTKAADGASLFGTISTQTTQANATAGFPTATTAIGYVNVAAGTKAPVPVYLVESQTVTDTVTASLSCAQIGRGI